MQNIGAEMIQKAIQQVGRDKVNTLSGQLALTNKKAFFKALKVTGGDREKAAWLTPLGKAAKLNWFTKVKVTTDADGNIIATFSR